MNSKEIAVKRKILISNSNLEWQNIVKLRLEVQRDFYDKQSLSISTYDKILDWRLRNQQSQVEKIKSASPYSIIKSITKCYCEIDHPNDEMKTRIKITKSTNATSCIIHCRTVRFRLSRLLFILRVTRQGSTLVPSTNHTRFRLGHI